MPYAGQYRILHNSHFKVYGKCCRITNLYNFFANKKTQVAQELPAFLSFSCCCGFSNTLSFLLYDISVCSRRWYF